MKKDDLAMFIYLRRHLRLIGLLLLSVSLISCELPGQSSQQEKSPIDKGSRYQDIQCQSKSSNPVTLNMYYGSEKRQWIDNVVAEFNARNEKACDGPIQVKAVPVASGQSMQQILDGSIKPDIWSPAGSAWIALLNDSWQKKHSSSFVGNGAYDAPSLVLSPVVIAMWQPEAEALGWPGKEIGWSDIASISTNPRGWAAYGHPELGDFKFGHTHPRASNSGLDAIIAMHYTATGKSTRITIEDVKNAKTKDFVANIESSVSHYGESTGFFADEMFGKGPDYLSAAVMYENLIVEARDGKTYPQVGKQYPSVVAIYPKEGTFYSDHPFVIPQADWMTPAKRTSAFAFRNFLFSPQEQKKALLYGFRPGDASIAIAAPIDKAHGVDPDQPKNILKLPSVDVISAMQASWEEQKRKVDVMLVLDRSGSMADPVGGVRKIDAAKQGLADFVKLLGDSDGLGVTVFSTDSDVLTPVGPLGSKRQKTLDQIAGIQEGGSTLLYDTIAEQFNSLQGIASKHIKALVVLTDGADTASNRTKDQLIDQIKPTGSNAGKGIKVFTIAYGDGAKDDELKQVADATGGKEYPGTPQNIREVYHDISQFF